MSVKTLLNVVVCVLLIKKVVNWDFVTSHILIQLKTWFVKENLNFQVHVMKNFLDVNQTLVIFIIKEDVIKKIVKRDMSINMVNVLILLKPLVTKILTVKLHVQQGIV